MERIYRQARQWYHGGFVATDQLLSKKLFSIDTLALTVSILSLAFTSDQLRIIWIEHTAQGVSIISWMWYSLAALVWTIFGISRKDKIIIATNVLWFSAALLVVIGIALYR